MCRAESPARGWHRAAVISNGEPTRSSTMRKEVDYAVGLVRRELEEAERTEGEVEELRAALRESREEKQASEEEFDELRNQRDAAIDERDNIQDELDSVKNSLECGDYF